MSRENPNRKVTVKGTLTGTETYTVEILLSVVELWGQSTSPVDTAIERTELLTSEIEDGDYVLRYTFGGKNYADNVRVKMGHLLAR